MAYNLETVLEENIETVLSRSIANTRPRDFYDIHIIFALRGNECDKNILKRALDRTSAKRGSSHVMQNYMEIIKEIKDNLQMQNLWEKYQKNFDCAKDISFEDTCNSVKYIMDYIMTSNDYAGRD